MKQLTIPKRLFLLVGLIGSGLLFVQCPSTCHRSNLPAAQSGKPANNKDAKKDLLRVRQLPDQGGVSYVEITIQPPTTGTIPSQYTLTAKTLAGEGDLLVAREKARGRLQYTVPLTLIEETNLADIYLADRHVESLKQGKSIRLKVMYQPKAGAQLGETYKAFINACAYDSGHRLVDQKSVDVSCGVRALRGVRALP